MATSIILAINKAYLLSKNFIIKNYRSTNFSCSKKDCQVLVFMRNINKPI